MGRGKIEIKRIENSRDRHATYSKRSDGIMKKAKEISVLCDAQLSLVIFSSSGKMHDFCTPSTTLSNILERYHNQSGNKLWDAKHEDLNIELNRIKKENADMRIKLSHLKGEDVTSLNINELMELEESLETGLSNIQDYQSELAKMARVKKWMLEDENRELIHTLGRLVDMKYDPAAAAAPARGCYPHAFHGHNVQL